MMTPAEEIAELWGEMLVALDEMCREGVELPVALDGLIVWVEIVPGLTG